MIINILNYSEANSYKPNSKQSAIIHILDSWDENYLFDIDEKYKYSFTYKFDDIDYISDRIFISLTDSQAKQISEDFETIHFMIEELTIHSCGDNERAYAVVAALKDLFNLSISVPPKINKFVYDKIIDNFHK